MTKTCATSSRRSARGNRGPSRDRTPVAQTDQTILRDGNGDRRPRTVEGARSVAKARQLPQDAADQISESAERSPRSQARDRRHPPTALNHRGAIVGARPRRAGRDPRRPEWFQHRSSIVARAATGAGSAAGAGSAGGRPSAAPAASPTPPRVDGDGAGVAATPQDAWTLAQQAVATGDAGLVTERRRRHRAATP